MLHPQAMESLENVQCLEQEILGCILTDPEKTLSEVADILRPEHFYYQAHQNLVEKIMDLYNKKRTQDINLVFLREFLAENGMAISDVTNMAVNVLSYPQIKSHCKKLKTIASWRKAQEKARQILSKDRIYEQDDLKRELDSALDELQKINDEQQTFSQINTMRDALMEAVDEIFSEKPIPKLETGITKLDLVTGGFLPGELIVIGGRASMGKTATSISFLDNFLREGKNIAYFSLEMTQSAMVKRLISCVGLVDGSNMRRTGKDGKIKLTESDVKKVMDAAALIDSYSGKAFWVDTSQTVEDIKAKTRKLKRTHGLDGIIVDYLGIIPSTYPKQIRREQVAHSIRYLKAIAKELHIPVIVLAQINRGVESRQDKRPTMADFKETGEIEQEADMALLLYRESYYTPDPSQEAEELEIIVGKHRNGATGMVRTCYFPKYTKVTNLEIMKSEHASPFQNAL